MTTLKKISKISLVIGLIFLFNPIETAYGCVPDPIEIFMSGSHFVIGEVIEVDVDEWEILLDVADYFSSDSAGKIEMPDSEPLTASFSGNYSGVGNFEPGDYVVASFYGSDFCGSNGREILHVTSLDYATLQVKDTVWYTNGHNVRKLTDFINHRAAYEYEVYGLRMYRQNRQNPIGFTVVYGRTSLILGQITVLDEDEITIEIWDYVTMDNVRADEEELPFDHLTLYRGRARGFNDFSIGDEVAIALRLPAGNEDTSTLTVMPIDSIVDIFSINILDNGSIQAEHIRDDSSMSALYTDLIQHRGNYPYVVTFGDTGRYNSVVRLVDGELIMIYEHEEVIEEEDLDELASSETVGSDWVTLAFVTVGIAGLLGLSGVVLVVKIRKQVLSDEK